MKYVKFYTLGCKVNMYETEAMRSLFEKRGFSPTDSDDADVFVINTCTVTAVGDKKSRQMIRRAKSKNPDAIVAVVGCYAQVSSDEVRKLDDVDIVLGTTDRSKIVDYVEQFNGYRIDAVRDDIGSEYEEIPSVQQSRTRAVLKIQDGCTNYCTYCIIPYARGTVRSRPLKSAFNEAQMLAAKGFTEVVLVGIHLSSYGKDIGLSLIDAIREICSVEGIKRVRLGSLEPMIITRQFVDEIAKLSKLCPSFHISMQSGCDETLKRMNRKYSSQDYLKALERLRSAIPNCAVTTDVMVGFPGESDEEFSKSLETVKTARFADLHVFQYSRRKGTPAATMDNQVDGIVKSERSKVMIETGKISKREYCGNYIGKTMQVLFEDEAEGYFEGLTDNFMRVLAKGENLSGRYKYVKISEICDDYCKGEVLEDNNAD